ncbi:DUF6338 family protein [Microbispora sp. NBC_01189]|uniref:DUF6338 family protein n=1 Tax=Microbispora sp. NBC_01189 TaxID=2903583 RepID=UPI002E0DBE99|nr:DUF6338 family protein [Microbispora sp. NBC_01189]
MPTTVPALLLLVALLFPGFAYMISRERAGTERRVSAWRETTTVVVVSVVADLTVLVLFLILRGLWAGIAFDVDALLRDPHTYLIGDRSGRVHGHYMQVGAWVLGLMLMAVLLAYCAALPRVRRWLKIAHSHPSAASAWYRLFDEFRGDRAVHVRALLENGAFFEGPLLSYSPSSEENADRELILVAPVHYKEPDATEGDATLLDCGAVTISARRILAISVSYVDPDVESSVTSSLGSEPRAAVSPSQFEALLDSAERHSIQASAPSPPSLARGKGAAPRPSVKKGRRRSRRSSP